MRKLACFGVLLSFGLLHLVTSVAYVSATNPALQATTASGGRYHSDGKMLLLTLQ